VANIPAAESKT